MASIDSHRVSADVAADERDERVLRIRPDAFFVRHADGVWLRNNQGSCSIAGAGAYELVSAVFGLLDGERTVDEICARFRGSAGDAARRLVVMLGRNGFVKEVQEPSEPVAAWMSELYPEHLAFLEYWSSSPVARLRELRSHAVACLGGGHLLTALAGALGDLGVARADLFTSDADAIREVAAAATARDGGLRWTVTQTGAERGLDLLVEEPRIREARCVLIATESEDYRSLAAAQLRARERGQVVGVLGRAGARIVATPLAGDDEQCCWECLWRSVVSPRAHDACTASTPAALGAFQLAQRVFCRLAGVGDAEDRGVTSVDLMTPTVRSHTPRRHPLCGRHDGASSPTRARPAGSELVRPNVPSPLDSDDVVAAQDRIVSAISSWTDPVTGPLLAVAEGDRPQLPLSASTCTVRTPASTAGDPGTRLFECLALAPREARNQVVLLALEWLAGETARLRHDAPRPAVYGAGWSPAEARYRALAHLLCAAAQDPSRVSSQPGRSGDGRCGDVREFLAGVLRDRGHGWRCTAVETLPTRFVRVGVQIEDRSTWAGVGVDRDHAIDHALLRAVASLTAGAETRHVGVAHVLPTARHWTEAVAPLIDGNRVVTDAGDLLGFLAGHAHLVALTPAGRR
jgi:hypothetical protein